MNTTLQSQEEVQGEAYSAENFLKNQDLQTLSREVGLTLGYLLGELGFSLLTDQNLQTLRGSLVWPLGIGRRSLDLVCNTGSLRRIV